MAVAYTVCYLGPGDDADLAVFTTSNTFFHDDSILFTVLVHFLYFRSFLDVPTAFLRCVSGRYFSTSSFVLCTDPAFGPSSVALVNLYGLVKYIALFYPLSHFAFLTLRSSNPSLSSSFALLYCFVTSFISDLSFYFLLTSANFLWDPECILSFLCYSLQIVSPKNFLSFVGGHCIFYFLLSVKGTVNIFFWF